MTPPPGVAELFDLSGSVALVTGGSRGLGRAIALALAAAGADVVVASRRLAACHEVAEAIERSTGRRALAVACHLGRWDQIDELVEAVYDHFGQLDILINNAGMSPSYDSVLDVNEKMFDAVIGVNLKGPFRLTSLLGTRMAAAGGGAVVNIGSIGAVFPRPNAIPYAAAKAGLNAMTVAFAHALAPTVRVNGIMPGAFLTDVTGSWDADAFAHAASTVLALGRAGRPEEIVGTVLYLVSRASSYTTGSIVTVDGGATDAPA
jgi:NAD(P)-dependent dehydrogenase (short-subunit alcohol dehydrogenase family)